MNSRTVAVKLDPVVQGQLLTRSPSGVNSTGPLEQFYRDVENAMGDRAGRMTNKRRADALLMLLAARCNRWGSERERGELLRKHLTSAKASPGSSARTPTRGTRPACAKPCRCALWASPEPRRLACNVPRPCVRAQGARSTMRGTPTWRS